MRFLREGRMQTLLIVVGVAAGVAVVAYISALITGLQSNTLEKTLGAQAHVTVSAQDDVVVAPGRPASGATTLAQTQPRAQRPRSIPSWAALVPVLEAMPEVAAVSPMVAGAGLALRGEASKSIALVGVDLDRYDRIVHLRSKVVEGVARLGPGEGIIGRDLAIDLGVRVGDSHHLRVDGAQAVPRHRACDDGGWPGVHRHRAAGVVENGRQLPRRPRLRGAVARTTQRGRPTHGAARPLRPSPRAAAPTARVRRVVV